MENALLQREQNTLPLNLHLIALNKNYGNCIFIPRSSKHPDAGL